MTVLLVILAILILLCILPIGARVIYDADGVRVKAVLGLIQFQIAPGKPKKPVDPETAAAEKQKKKKAKAEKKAKKQSKKGKKKSGESEKPQEKKPLGAKMQEFLPFIRLGLQALGDLRWIFTVRKLNIDVTYGGTDAGKIAMNYGILCGTMGTAMSILTGALRIKKYHVQPILDYDCRDMRVTADACVTITLGRVIVFLVRYGWKALMLWRSKKRKGGATV